MEIDHGNNLIIYIAMNSIFYGGKNPIEITKNFIQDIAFENIIEIKFCLENHELTYDFTKVFNYFKFMKFK